VSLPLAGITVIDACWLLPGQFATMLLRDLGARVIKIERPGGDYSRRFDEAGWATVNRGKAGLTLDLKQPAGLEVLYRLAGRADVLVEGFRPGVMGRLGADYEALRPHAPHLVYCSITGFGQTGSHRLQPGHGLNYAGLTGLVSFADGGDKAVGQSADLSSSLYAAIAILAALRQRDRDGTSQYIDVAITDTTYALMTEHLAGAHAAGERHDDRPGFGVFRGCDGTRFTLAAVEDQFWDALCTLIDRPEWSRDERFSDDIGRRRHHAELRAGLIDAFGSAPGRDWLDRLAEAGIPAGPINAMADAARDPYAFERDIVEWVDQPGVGTIAQVQFPARLSATSRVIPEPAPDIGQHTGDLLTELGYAPAEQEAMRSTGAV
jgi:formyl-CoA transferase